jgi:L-amino acid N-acyltransferase YncA
MDGFLPKIRDASADDAAACAAIYAPFVAGTVISFEAVPPSPEEMGRRIAEAVRTHAWLVAEARGLVIGYAYAHPFAPRAAYRWACETSIYLDAEHRGQGVGRALYQVLLDRLAGRGYRTVLAGMTLPNDASAGLHLSLGYQPAGVYQRVGWKNDAWHDVAWYQRGIGHADAPPTEPR